MKITCNTTGTFKEAGSQAALKSFLLQYDEKFPGIEYLHLELEEDPTQRQTRYLTQKFHYSSSGKMLQIHVFKQGSYQATPYEVLTELRGIFDAGVAEHLKNYQEAFNSQLISTMLK